MGPSNHSRPLDRSQPPSATASKRFELPPFERSVIGNLEILCLPRRGFPIMAMSLIAPDAGAERQPLDHAGLASLTAASLTEGTSSLSAVEFQARAEQLGGFVSSGADWEAVAVHAGSLSEHISETFQLAATAYLDPAMREDDVERLRSRRQSELARRAQEPASMAGAEFIRRLYGPEHRYAIPLIGDQANLERIDVAGMQTHWTKRSQRLALVVVGDVDFAQVQELAQDHFAALATQTPHPRLDTPDYGPEPVHSGIRVFVVDRPKAAQTQLLIGHHGPGRLHPDRPVLRLLNAVFGGKFSSRINLNLRERHGYTYGANSSFAARRGPGPFAVQSAVENEYVGKACEQVLLELERIRDEPVGKEELDDARSYLLGVQPYGFQSLDGWASALGNLAVFDLPNEWYSTQQEALAAVEADDLQRAANAHLHPSHATVVAVGPAQQIASQFDAFDTVHIVPARTPTA